MLFGCHGLCLWLLWWSIDNVLSNWNGYCIRNYIWNLCIDLGNWLLLWCCCIDCIWTRWNAIYSGRTKLTVVPASTEGCLVIDDIIDQTSCTRWLVGISTTAWRELAGWWFCCWDEAAWREVDGWGIKSARKVAISVNLLIQQEFARPKVVSVLLVMTYVESWLKTWVFAYLDLKGSDYCLLVEDLEMYAILMKLRFVL